MFDERRMQDNEWHLGADDNLHLSSNTSKKNGVSGRVILQMNIPTSTCVHDT